MIIDNENDNLKVFEWINKYTQNGSLSIVTGYFTIGAIAYLSKVTKDKIDQYRFILGDIVNFESDKERALDLLNENIGIEASLALSQVAREAVAFLELENVTAKTLEPNFCHAKVYLYKNGDKDPQKDYYISGSSNMTEAGMGMKITNNVELNIGSFGSDPQYNELIKWFEQLWLRPQAHNFKSVTHENGKVEEIPFKKYLIDEITKVFKEYTPKDLYYKVLFELFGNDVNFETNNPEFNRQIGKLENTEIHKALYEFQQKGVISLIKMLQKYNGAILADAVGLGKTWTALAVMKYYEMQGHTVVMLCPKKLEQNWSKFLEPGNRFENDKFDFKLRFHTDLIGERWDSYQRKNKFNLTKMLDDKPKLLVIDESHNLRNGKTNSYKFLNEEILQKTRGNIKVLMLSATPINNSLIDIRNQFKLMVRGNNAGFSETLDIKNIDYTFNHAQGEFNKWTKKPDAKLGEFIKLLPPQFFALTDALTVARTRKMIEGQQNNLIFPKKHCPENIFVTPKQIGNFESFEELFEEFPPLLSGYLPSLYTETEEERIARIEKKHKKSKGDKSVLQDEQQRDMFLVKMMYILLVKRLESSWFSFQSTVDKILKHHQNALDRIMEYEKTKKEIVVEVDEDELFSEDDIPEPLEEFSLGKNRPVRVSDIDKAGNIDRYKKDLKEDLKALQLLQSNLEYFQKHIKAEDGKKSVDEKLAVLLNRIESKQATGNKKLVIFTVYKDTAFYLFDQLTKRGFDRVAVVSGDASRISGEPGETKKFEQILERFAPYTKLYGEKDWSFIPSSKKISPEKQFEEWKSWVENVDNATFKKLQNPIDILIATDVLSEGQNLQDADMVVNYDIHWNPVRVIQRMGRIDRLGSINKEIFAINFWPTDNINSYLNLQRRIEQRMASMKLAGSEVNLQFSDTFKEMAEDATLEQAQKDRMLKQMESTWDDIETSRQTIGFDSFSLEIYRQELLMALNEKKNYYDTLPKGIYTGFKSINETCPKTGMIALLGFPTRPTKTAKFQYKGYELIYIDSTGKQVLMNQKEVLDALAKHKDCERDNDGLRNIDQGEATSIEPLAESLNLWINKQAVEEEIQADGTVKQRMGTASMDLLNKLKSGSKQAVQTLKTSGSPADNYKPENFDLITWFIVNR